VSPAVWRVHVGLGKARRSHSKAGSGGGGGTSPCAHPARQPNRPRPLLLPVTSYNAMNLPPSLDPSTTTTNPPRSARSRGQLNQIFARPPPPGMCFMSNSCPHCSLKPSKMPPKREASRAYNTFYMRKQNIAGKPPSTPNTRSHPTGEHEPHSTGGVARVGCRFRGNGPGVRSASRTIDSGAATRLCCSRREEISRRAQS